MKRTCSKSPIVGSQVCLNERGRRGCWPSRCVQKGSSRRWQARWNHHLRRRLGTFSGRRVAIKRPSSRLRVSKLRCSFAEGLRCLLTGLGVADVLKDIAGGSSLQEASSIGSNGIYNTLSNPRFVSAFAGDVERLECFDQFAVLLVPLVVI